MKITDLFERRCVNRNRDGLSEEEYARLTSATTNVKRKLCIYCKDRMMCEKYLIWLKDPNAFLPPRANKCERYEEAETDKWLI